MMRMVSLASVFALATGFRRGARPSRRGAVQVPRRGRFLGGVKLDMIIQLCQGDHLSAALDRALGEYAFLFVIARTVR